MAFTSGNIGKEIMQKALSPGGLRSKIVNLPDVKKIKMSDANQLDKAEKRITDRKEDEPNLPSVLPYEKNAEEKYKCTCHVCEEKRGIKPKIPTTVNTANAKTISPEGNEKGFSYLLRILMPDRGNAPKGLKFLIADTLIFSSGEPRFLLYNSRDKYIRFAKHKDRLSLPEMRKFFQGRKKRKELDGINFFNENTITMAKKIKETAERARNEQFYDPMNAIDRKEKKVPETTAQQKATAKNTKDAAEKARDGQPYDSINASQKRSSPPRKEKKALETIADKEKLAEKARNDQSYDPIDASLEGSSPPRKEKKILETTAHKEIVICKYTDESLQVMSELDFAYLMMKRKIEAVWAQLDYIQTFIKLKKEHPYYIRVDFEHERDKKNPLYERARDYIYYLVEEREPELDGFDYATDEDYFQEQLKEKNIYEYCQYLNFKFICYFDGYCGTRIKEMISEYAWEDTNLVYLVNAHKIKFFNLDEIDDYLLREIEIVNEEERQKALEKLYATKTSPYQGKVEILSAFRQYYDGMKKEMGIQKEFDDSILENPQSNEAFRQMNPEASFTLYDVMTDVKQFAKFKTWLQHRSQEPGAMSNLYKSALKYAESSSNYGMISTAKSFKSTSSKPDKDRNLKQDNSAKVFLKKLKALDICGNGASKKKYIHSTEILYRSDVYSGRRLIASATPKKMNMVSPTHGERPISGISAKNDTGLSISTKMKNNNKSQKSTPQQSTFDQSVFNKTKSLTSILYLKPSN